MLQRPEERGGNLREDWMGLSGYSRASTAIYRLSARSQTDDSEDLRKSLGVSPVRDT